VKARFIFNPHSGSNRRNPHLRDRAIAFIKEHFAEPLQIEELAKRVNMSPSALHGHFKAVAAMSPIQYQKRLRLEEARRRLLSEGTSAETVAYEVGYASASGGARARTPRPNGPRSSG